MRIFNGKKKIVRPNQRQYNQFRKLSGELNDLLSSGKFFQLSRKHQQALISKLRELFYRLVHVFSEFRLKKILAGAAVLIGFSTAQHANAQTFGPPQISPFGITINPATTINFTFADLDNDGDDDLLLANYGGTLLYQENIGTAQNPSYKAPVTNPFNLSGNSTYGLLPELVDLDADGDSDLVVMETYYGNMLYFENTGTKQSPNFAAPVTNPHGFVANYYYILPAFADMDNDGDLDLWLGGGYSYYGHIAYFENNGTPQQPSWGTVQLNPFNFSLPAYTYIISPTLADLDHDGDLDLLLGAYYYDYNSYFYGAGFYYYENKGTNQSPDFSGAPLNGPFNLSIPNASLTYIAFPKFVNLDEDGDMDIMCLTYGYSGGVGTLNLYYFENFTIMPGIESSNGEKPIVLYPNPTSNQLFIRLEDPNPALPLSLTNSMGQTVWQSIIHEKEVIIPLIDFPNGTYLIRVGDHVQTVIKQ